MNSYIIWIEHENEVRGERVAAGSRRALLLSADQLLKAGESILSITQVSA